MDIGIVRRVVKVEPEPFPPGHPENAPEEPSRREVQEPVPVEVAHV